MTIWIARRWPLLAFIGACLFFDLLFPFLSDSLPNFQYHWAFIATIVGIWLGQIQFAVAIAGVSGRTWLEGLVIGLALVLTGLSTFAFAMLMSREVQSLGTNELVIVAALPGLLLSATLPLIFLRQWRGWRLVSIDILSPSSNLIRANSSGIADLFVATTVIASVLILARVPAVVWDVGQWNVVIGAERAWNYWLYFGGLAILLSSLAAMFVVPSCLVVFRLPGKVLPTIAAAFLWMTVVAFVASAVSIPSLLYGNFLNFQNDIAPWMTFSGAAMATLLIGLSTVPYSGYALGFKKRKAIESPLENELADPQRLTPARAQRILAGVLLTMAIVANIPVAQLESERKQAEQKLAELEQRATKLGGSIGVQGRTLNSLIAWPSMTDADLRALDLSNLHTISLANSQVTDAVLNDLKDLQIYNVDLSLTQITEQGLANSGWGYFYELKLSSSQFTGQCFENLALPHRKLDLSNSGVTDATLKYLLHKNFVSELDLSHTPISDAGLLQLQGIMRLERINLSHTQVTAAGILAADIAKSVIIAPNQFSAAEQMQLRSSMVNIEIGQ